MMSCGSGGAAIRLAREGVGTFSIDVAGRSPSRASRTAAPLAPTGSLLAKKKVLHGLPGKTLLIFMKKNSLSR
jgi:hypothetical protein